MSRCLRPLTSRPVYETGAECGGEGGGTPHLGDGQPAFGKSPIPTDHEEKNTFEKEMGIGYQKALDQPEFVVKEKGKELPKIASKRCTRARAQASAKGVA